MTAILLGFGDILFLDDVQKRVIERTADGRLCLEAVSDGSRSVVTDEELAAALVDGRLRIVRHAQDVARLSSIMEDFHSLPDDMKAEARRRHRYLTGLEKKGIVQFKRGETELALAALAVEFGDPKPPSYATLCRWREKAGTSKDLRRLVDQKARRGNREAKLHPEVRAVMERMIAERYLTPERCTVVTLHAAIMHAIARLNESRSADDQLRTPSLKTVYEAVGNIDRRDVMLAREGRRAAAHAFDPAGKAERTDVPLGLVEMDHTKLDLFVVDDRTFLPIGRPWLTMAVDSFSRMPVGVYVGFEPPSIHSVMQCLRNAILPKTWLADRFPEVENDWPCHGIPYEISVDRGMEFLSEGLADFCASVGISIRHSPTRKPWYKGTVERYFGTINTNLLHEQRGTTFSNILERGEYDPAKNAVIPFETLLRILHKWLVDVFARTPHRGLKGIPAVEWLKACQRDPVRTISHVSDLDVLLGNVETRTLRRTGIELNHLFYMDPGVVAWLRDPAFHEKAPDRKVKIKFDPSNLSAIRVLDPRTLRYETVPVVPSYAGYAGGLTKWQHEVILRHVRQTMQEEVDLESLARAKEHIAEMVAQAMGAKRRSSRTMQKAARWAGIGRLEVGLDAEAKAQRNAIHKAPLALPAPSHERTDARDGASPATVDAEFEELMAWDEALPKVTPSAGARKARQDRSASGGKTRATSASKPLPARPAPTTDIDDEDDVYAELGISATRKAPPSRGGRG